MGREFEPLRGHLKINELQIFCSSFYFAYVNKLETTTEKSSTSVLVFILFIYTISIFLQITAISY